MQKGYEMAFRTAGRSGETGIRFTFKNQAAEHVPLASHGASIPQLYALDPGASVTQWKPHASLPKFKL